LPFSEIYPQGGSLFLQITKKLTCKEATMNYTTLSEAVDSAFIQMSGCIRDGADGKRYILDPNDSSRVPGHYGETHFCAAMLYHSDRCGDSELSETALDLLNGILAHWAEDERTPDYHADFNNFALALVYEKLVSTDRSELADLVAKKLLETSDSRNHTVNWLPMRAYTNLLKFRLTNKQEFFNIAADALKTVKGAQYQDGLFDDLLPKGESFNLQYCISTAATVQLIYNRFKEYRELLPCIDLKKTMSTLYELVLPAGDMNYMGRGCNQIFAWGPWVYLMSAYSNKAISENSLLFLSDRFDSARRNQNLMLNEYKGSDRVLWWDYHHYSVYMPHFLMWYELSLMNTESILIDKTSSPSDSGMRIYRNSEFCVVTFSGRKHYLVEKGPAIVALWSRAQGAIFKCGHGASNGVFSNNSFNPLLAYFHHFGVVEIRQTPIRIANKYIRKLYKLIVKERHSVQLIPEFINAKVEMDAERLTISYDLQNKANSCFIFPAFSGIENIRFLADEKAVPLRFIGSTQTQYGDVQLYITEINYCRKCCLTIG